jgi:hypothetical protein
MCLGRRSVVGSEEEVLVEDSSPNDDTYFKKTFNDKFSWKTEENRGSPDTNSKETIIMITEN